MYGVVERAISSIIDDQAAKEFLLLIQRDPAFQLVGADRLSLVDDVRLVRIKAVPEPGCQPWLRSGETATMKTKCVGDEPGAGLAGEHTDVVAKECLIEPALAI